MHAIIYSDDKSLIDSISKTLQDCHVSSRTIAPSVPAEDILKVIREDEMILLASADPRPSLRTTLKKLSTGSNNKLIVIAPMRSPDQVISFVREGAYDLLDTGDQMHLDLERLVDRLRRRSTTSKDKSIFVGVIPTGDISDANMLAINVSALLSKRYDGCELIELRWNTADLAIHLKLNPNHNIVDLLAQPNIDLQMYQQTFAEHPSGIKLLAGGSATSAPSTSNEVGIQQLLSCASTTPRPKVLCFEDTYDKGVSSVLPLLDHIYLACRVDVASLWRTKVRVDWIAMNGIDPNRVHVVAIDDSPGVHPETSDIKKVINKAQVHRIEYDIQEQAISITMGQPVSFRCPNSPMSRSLREFVNRLGEDSVDRVHSARNSLPFWKSAKSLLFSSLSKSC